MQDSTTPKSVVLTHEEFFKPDNRHEGPQIEGTERVYFVEVFECNWFAVNVFQACRFRQNVVAGANGGIVVPEGIDATELLSVCELYDIPREDRPLILEAVRTMSDAACKYLSQR